MITKQLTIKADTIGPKFQFRYRETEMAHLQCISAIKNCSRMPTAKSLSAIANQDFAAPKKQKDNKLYNIEIVDEDGPNVKVHYVGYDEKYDEWKPRSQVVMKKPVGDRTDYSPFVELVSCIKKKGNSY